jgi:alpha-D-xyloside xylohydrolase
MPIYKKEGNKLIYHYDAETLWIEPWGQNSFRVRSTKQADMPPENWALTTQKDDLADIEINEQFAMIKNGKIHAVITKSGKITFYNSINQILLEEYVRNRRDLLSKDCSALEIEAREFRPILGGDYSLSMRFVSTDPDEKIYGMGQYQQPYLNLKGIDLELAQRNSQASVPFALSSLGYGFLWNNPGVGRVTFGKNITTWQAVSTKVLDYWICAGDTPAEIEETYASVTGTVPMMPDFAMGFWQCKLRYQTQEELLDVAREYKKRGLPISVIVCDYFHWPYQGEWKFDPVYWPDPDAMVKELQEMDIELMVSIWPTVDKRSENYKEMEAEGYLIRTDRGVRVGLDFEGQTINFDATHPDARKYVWEKAKKNYYDRGIKTFWLDEAEPECTYYDFDIYRYHLGPNVQVGNIYPLNYAQTFYEGMEAEGQQNIINLLRCAWAGSQKYGALVWSGDIASSFESLRNQFAAGLNMGIAGIPWWTTDIGGFHGGNPDDPAFRELLVRWFEYGTFCPVMRLHGDREPKQPQFGTSGGATCLSGADNEVWSFGETVYEICKKYLNLRETLKPYITKLMLEAHEKGTPVMRPLFYDFPKDLNCWENESQYMFGPDMLIAPVMVEGQRKQKVYLPADAQWKDYWSHEIYEGGITIEVDAELDTIPVFLKIH